MNKPSLPAVSALFGAIFLATATAASVNVQFGSDVYIGWGAIPNGGIYWNFYDEPSNSPTRHLKDGSGEETPAAIHAIYQGKFKGGPPPTTKDGKGRNPGHLLGSGLYGPVDLHILGLDPSKSYDVYVYVFNSDNNPTTVTLTDAKGSSSRNPSPVNQEDDFRLNENYVVFSNTTPSNTVLRPHSGSLQIKVEGAETGLNGLQLVEKAQSEPNPSPSQEPNPPTVKIRPNSGKIVTRKSRVTLHGTARSDVGLRAVRTSLNRNTWRKARGTTHWTAVISAKERTRVFVRAEDVNGTFSSVESVVIVPKRNR